MEDCDILLSIPEVLGRCLLAEWLEYTEIVELDNSYCSSTLRHKFLTLAGGPDVVYDFNLFSKFDPPGYIEWLNLRSMRVSKIRLPHRFIVQESRYGTLREEFFKISGSSLKSVEFPKERQSNVDLETEDEEDDTIIEDIEYSHIKNILQYCPNLSQLTVPEYIDSDDQFLQDITMLCPQLQKLTVPSAALFAGDHTHTDTDWSAPGVKSVTLSSDTSSPDLLLALVTTTPALDTLGFWSRQPSFPFHTNVTVWCQLRTLHVSHTALSDALVMPILALNTHLTCLYLQSSSNLLTDATLECVAEYCRALSELHIRSDGVTDEGIAAVLQHCTLLTTLNLDHTKGLSDTTLYNIATHCTHLHTLSIENCRGYTEQALTVLAQHTALRSLKLTPKCILWNNSENALQIFSSKGCHVECCADVFTVVDPLSFLDIYF